MNLPDGCDMNACPLVLRILVRKSTHRDRKRILYFLLEDAEFYAMISQRGLQCLARLAIFWIDRRLDNGAGRLFIRSCGDLDVNIAITAVGPGELHISAGNDDEL